MAVVSPFHRARLAVAHHSILPLVAQLLYKNREDTIFPLQITSEEHIQVKKDSFLPPMFLLSKDPKT